MWDIELDRSIFDSAVARATNLRNACHEVAHAVVSELLYLPIRQITVFTDRDNKLAGGDCSPLGKYRVAHLESAIITALAGYAFNKLVSKGEWETGNEPIRRNEMTDMRYAQEMACERLEHFHEPVDEQTSRLLLVARDMVVANWDFILAVGWDLATVERITGKEFRKLMVEHRVSYRGSRGVGDIETSRPTTPRRGKEQGSAAAAV
jgi:hypothetical protein